MYTFVAKDAAIIKNNLEKVIDTVSAAHKDFVDFLYLSSAGCVVCYFCPLYLIFPNFKKVALIAMIQTLKTDTHNGQQKDRKFPKG